MALKGGIYSGVLYLSFDLNASGAADLDDLIFDSIIAQRLVESVVSIFIMPSEFYSDTADPVSKTKNIARPTTLDGYTPRNQKLLTYPFISLGVDTGTETTVYRYEWSGAADHSIQVGFVCGMSPNPEIVIFPIWYNGSESPGLGTYYGNFTERVTLSGFPQCAFPIDSYAAYLASGAAPNQAASVAGSLIGGAVSGGPAGIATGLIGAAATISNMVHSMNRGNTVRGNQGSGTLVASRGYDVYFKRLCCQAQYARIIDDYFDRYGYATQRIKIPNRHVRPKWTYVQTKDCAAVGGVPADDMAKIKSIYNKGITFWDEHATVGDYTQNNRPV